MEDKLIIVVPVTKTKKKKNEDKAVDGVRALLQHQSRLTLIIVNLSKNLSEAAP